MWSHGVDLVANARAVLPRGCEHPVLSRNTGPGHTAPFGPTTGPGNDPGLYRHLPFVFYTLRHRTGRSEQRCISSYLPMWEIRSRAISSDLEENDHQLRLYTASLRNGDINSTQNRLRTWR